jgi:hypothetical protein
MLIGLGVLPANAKTAYDLAIQTWTTPEELNAWIAAKFSYDVERAIQLSATQRAKHGTIAIYEPAAFFERGAGLRRQLRLRRAQSHRVPLDAPGP